jgi:hypothetical protein
MATLPLGWACFSLLAQLNFQAPPGGGHRHGGMREGRGERAQEHRADLVSDPRPFVGKTVRVIGHFRGRNLFDDLPSVSQRKPEDWVLKLQDLPIWVTGKPPRGDGFSLDPESKEDAFHWVEVTGKPEVVDGVVYFHASKVSLARPPGDAPAGPMER